MEISPMRSRITIQKATVSSDAIGNRTNTWQDYHSCFSSVNLASGKEYAVAGQMQSGDTLVFILRWCERLRDLNGTQFRISFGGDLFNIVSVDDVMFRHETYKLIGERIRR